MEDKEELAKAKGNLATEETQKDIRYPIEMWKSQTCYLPDI